MKKRKLLVWPPKVGSRICYDVGNTNSKSWEVRAIVDGDVAVVKRWLKHKGWYLYEILERLDVEIGNEMGLRYFEGPLPKQRIE